MASLCECDCSGKCVSVSKAGYKSLIFPRLSIGFVFFAMFPGSCNHVLGKEESNEC